MRISSTSRNIEVGTITLFGRLDALNAPELRVSLSNHLDSDVNRLIVDLSNVGFVDSAGLAALVSGMKRARTEGGDLRLIAPEAEDAKRVFVLTKFDQVFSIFADLESAQQDW